MCNPPERASVPTHVLLTGLLAFLQEFADPELAVHANREDLGREL